MKKIYISSSDEFSHRILYLPFCLYKKYFQPVRQKHDVYFILKYSIIYFTYMGLKMRVHMGAEYIYLKEWSSILAWGIP